MVLQSLRFFCVGLLFPLLLPPSPSLLGPFSCCVTAWVVFAPLRGAHRIADSSQSPSPLLLSAWRRTTALSMSVPSSSSRPVSDEDVDQQQVEGTKRIRMAMRTCGWDPADITIQWQPQQKKIVVTVVDNERTYLSAPEGDGPDGAVEAGLLEDDDEIDDGYDADDESEELQPEEDGATILSSPSSSDSGIDLAVLARAINVALEGLEPIASSYVIEVTTPGIASNNRSDQPLVGDIMFQAYRGFDVTAVFDPPDNKKKKPQRIEGKLVERNEQHTIVNVKGRMRKLLNEHVVEVCLPPAKKEKK